MKRIAETQTQTYKHRNGAQEENTDIVKAHVAYKRTKDTSTATLSNQLTTSMYTAYNYVVLQIGISILSMRTYLIPIDFS